MTKSYRGNKLTISVTLDGYQSEINADEVIMREWTALLMDKEVQSVGGSVNDSFSLLEF